MSAAADGCAPGSGFHRTLPSKCSKVLVARSFSVFMLCCRFADRSGGGVVADLCGLLSNGAIDNRELADWAARGFPGNLASRGCTWSSILGP